MNKTILEQVHLNGDAT